ncbi:phosducin family protein [Rhizodiscina lignyota]|uniref:Phosducin family protein n=1 Tax=Rhizodiscina lignyota TaxID=1504668 RepID=A0A9P4IT64_9PEZI|nr:phosducin family protein [Rhizodiscina lignyota]
MNPPDIPINVPVDDPNADTEWNDILRKHKIIPEKPPSPTPIIEEALTEARRLAHENRLEGKDLDELAELEDEEDEEFLNEYKKKRFAELSHISQASVFNQVYHLQKPDYSRDVTEASQKAFIFVLLTAPSDGNTESHVAIEAWRQLAAKFGDVKFCQMRADLCIEGYPERNCPTILVYKDGDIKKQIVTLKELNGVGTKVEDFSKILVEVGAIQSTDSRLSRPSGHDDIRPNRSIREGTVGRAVSGDDEDSDWD